MPVTKAVQASGRFALTLDPAAPRDIRSAVELAAAAFGHVLILPAQVDTNAADLATLYTKSIYTGVVYGIEDALTLNGYHATSWLEDPSGLGDVNERASLTLTYKFKDWVTQILAGQTAIGTGTITDIVPATTLGWDPLKMTPREMLDYVCTFFRNATGNPSIEWQVTDYLYLNAGTVSDLYTLTAQALLTPMYDGPDPVVKGLQATLGFTDDVEDYATRELLYYSGGGVGVTGTTTTWKDGYGNLVKRKRVDEDTNIPAGLATYQAASIIDQYDQARRQLTATTSRQAVMLDVPVGSYVYVWDQDKGIYSLSNQVAWRGTVATPDLVRVMAIDMPVEAGMGVYLVPGGASTATDLSQWVVPERPGAKLTLGALERRYAL